MLQTFIKNYKILYELGHGGMAVVYLAHDNKFDTNVAVKLLNKEYVHNDNIRKRFLAEARNMYRMSHPNIIKVTDLIDDGDTVAFVMEHIEGETLKDYLERRGKLTDEEIKSLFTQMLDAVGYVHEQKLVHRDIKPSNFMITPNGKVKLMDFGIAKNTDANSAEYTQTGTGMQMGTPMYMSPEQITETKSVTAQSDIYSLGVVLWQMVMGQKPYDTNTLSTFQLQMKIVQEPLQSCDSNFNSIIQKATEKDPFKRYNSSSEFKSNIQLSFYSQSINPKEYRSFNDETVFNQIFPNELTLIDTYIGKSNSLIQIIDFKYDLVYDFSCGLAQVLKKNGADWFCGFINENDELIIQFSNQKNKFYNEYFKNNYCIVQERQEFYLIDKQGNPHLHNKNKHIESLEEGWVNVLDKNRKSILYDSNLSKYEESSFEEEKFVSGDVKCKAIKINGKWGILNADNHWINAPIYQIDEMKNGLCKIIKDVELIDNSYNSCKIKPYKKPDKWKQPWGFKNEKNEIVIPCDFDEVGDFFYGYAPVKKNERWSYINENGDLHFEDEFDYAHVISQEGFGMVMKNKKYGFLKLGNINTKR